MPPDARQNFRRNAELWMQMSPEQRNLMRQRETMRRQMITREADAAVRNSGLQLNPQERARFESRYIQERRKVEQTLRQQIEAERQKELPALIQQLKKEFQIDQPAKSPATKPPDSPHSKR
jgi:glutamate synthase domain-containing protein 2